MASKAPEMPWMPDFLNAMELARGQQRATGQADPVRQYFTALSSGDTHALETVWPGAVVVYDPLSGEVRGHRRLSRFVRRNQSWLAERHARIETVASTSIAGRAAVELLAHLAGDGREVAWPVAVVAESPDDRSVVFRTYCNRWPMDGQRHVRPPVLKPANVPVADAVSRYHAALEAGDAEAAAAAFAADGYVREPFGPDYIHRGAAELRAFFTTWLAAGGIGLQYCAVTDDGTRCALEYNCVHWGSHDQPTQAGLTVYERGQDGLLAAARVYDEVDRPAADRAAYATAGQ
jgi:ketosteroid isomerase-like protein